MMNQVQYSGNPAAYFNIFKVSLTRQQQKVLTSMIPSNYSFQPFKCLRSIDEESLKSEHIKTNKKKLNKEHQKDPDYSASYPAAPKQIPVVKIQSNTAIPGGEQFIICYLILKKLKKSIYAWPFKAPVDPASLVLQPMDLRTVQENLRKEAYKHPGQFHRDIYKILMNSYKFNQKNSDVFNTTSEFQEQYLRIVIEAKEGKLTLNSDKKIKTQGSILEETPSLARQKMSEVETKVKNPQKNIKKEKRQKQKQKQRQMMDIIQKEQEKIKEKGKIAKTVQDYVIQKQRIKKQEKLMIQKEKEKEKEKEKAKIAEKIRQNEENLFKRFQIKKQEINEIIEKAPVLIKTKTNHAKDEESYNMSQQNIKKSKTQEFKIKKEKPFKQKNSEISQTFLQKEVIQVQNQKNIVLAAIQKKLADLLKKLNEYQIPKNKQKPVKNTEGYLDVPILSATTPITNPEKRKLAQKINMLPSEELRYVIEICFRNKRNKQRDEEGIYDIDLDKLDAKTLKQLSNFVAMKTKATKKIYKTKNDNSICAESLAENYDDLQSEEIYDQEFKIDNDDGQENNDDPMQNEIPVHEQIRSIHSDLLEPHFHYFQQEMIQVAERDNPSNSMQYDENPQFHF